MRGALIREPSWRSGHEGGGAWSDKCKLTGAESKDWNRTRPAVIHARKHRRVALGLLHHGESAVAARVVKGAVAAVLVPNNGIWKASKVSTDVVTRLVEPQGVGREDPSLLEESAALELKDLL